MAVMGNMDIGHYPVVITDTCKSAAGIGPPIYRAIFADRIPVSDFQPRIVFTVIFFILGIITQGGELEDPVLLADDRGATNHDMRTDPRISADFHTCPDQRIGTNLDTVRNNGLRMNDGSRINQAYGFTTVVRNSAEATTRSSTLAVAENFQIFLFTVR